MADVEELKRQLALACRMLANEHLFDQSGHITARHPSNPGLALIHPHGTSRYDVEPGEILTIDAAGNVVEGDDRPPTEFRIHTCIYAARPDVQAVVHIHSRMATVFGIAGVDVVPVTNYAAFLGPGPLPTYPDPRLVHSDAQGQALIACLGSKRACIMRAHGSVAVGATVPEAFIAAVHLEENALRQHLALQIGQPAGYSDQELA
ncbi:MAG: class II aldolase/adducin family protein, partial [Chloroflexota bacterium]